MKVSKIQFSILSLLTVCSILWLLLLTCYREYWGFWQSPDIYRFLSKEYPDWFRDYIRIYYDATLIFTGLVYLGWLSCGWARIAVSKVMSVVLIGMTLLMGLTLGVMCSNNFIHFLDSGHLHGHTHLQVRE